MRKKNPESSLDLTEAEKAILRSSSAPDEVKAFVARSHDTIGTRIMAYEKIAAAARAERLALQEIRRLHMARDAITDESEYRHRISQLEGEKLELLALNQGTQSQLARATAIPAMAVHSDD